MAFYQCLAQFRPEKPGIVQTRLHLMGMMASSLSVVLLGWLKMRDFQ